MSNKIVPGVYRTVIDDVMESIKPEFEEYGVPEDVLAQLQAKWEEKVVASHVADFEISSNTQQQPQQQHQYSVQHPAMHLVQGHAHYAPAAYAGHPAVKAEPVDSRYMLAGHNQGLQYTLPPLPGPQLAGLRPPPHLGGQTSVLSFPTTTQSQAQNRSPGTSLGRAYVPLAAAAATAALQQQQQQQQQQPARSIPQTDGPSDDSDESPSPPPFAPHSNHPSLPQRPPQASTSTQESEAINSDLDDSDTENEADNEDAAGADSDIVFCTYDKVARVKNKWKCILKDGMIHINGKDYLFQKCTGEFEW